MLVIFLAYSKVFSKISHEDKILNLKVNLRPVLVIEGTHCCEQEGVGSGLGPAAHVTAGKSASLGSHHLNSEMN